MPRIIRRASLAYPGGRPGFDTTHFASRGVTLSVAAFGGGMVNLLNGMKGSVQGSPVPVIDGVIGQAMNIGAGGNADGFQFPNSPTNVTPPLSITAAGIFIATAVSSYQTLITNSLKVGAGGGFQFNINDTFASPVGVDFNNYGFNSLAPNATTPFALTAGIPYFLVGSASDAGGVGSTALNCSFLAKNLLTGKIQAFQQASFPTGSYGGTSGTYQIGNYTGTGDGVAHSKIATAMWAQAADPISAYLPLNQQLKWAEAPWDFWYPPKMGNMLLTSVKHSAPPPTPPSMIFHQKITIPLSIQATVPHT